MYHPEYQVLDFPGPKKWALADKELGEQIAFRMSLLLNRYARQNTNTINAGFEKLFEKDLAVSRHPSQSYQMIGDLYVYAYGYQEKPLIPDNHQKTVMT